MESKNIFVSAVILIGFVIIVAFVITGDRTYTYTPLFDEVMPEAVTETFNIAPASTALTFARYQDESGIHIMLVESYSADWITGIDLNAVLETPQTDILSMFASEGYDNLSALNETSEVIRVSSDRVVIPIVTNDRHIAMGGNYLEHGKEVAIETPWIFPKIVEPTTAYDNVPWNTTMLDPEVEMGLVVLDDLRREDGFPRYIGLILVNDFSDRKRLVQNSDPNSDEPCTGCTEGKSREKYLPIGNLLVIPRDFEAFYPQIELRLYVNQQLRQKAPVGELTLKPRQIIDTVWDNADALYDYNGKKVPLLSNFDVIQRGSIILTGTPAGVVFSPPTFRQIMAGLPGYIFSFDWSNRSPLEGYFKGAEESGAFLQKGDQVISSADYLGILYQTIYP